MTRKWLKKNAYRMIVREDRSHQETFNSLRQEQANGLEELADDISRIPSRARQNQYQLAVYSYVALLGLTLVLRSISIVLNLGFYNSNINVILLLVALGLIVPGLGIFGALTRRHESYRVVGILIVIGIIRSAGKGEIRLDPLSLLWLTPSVVAAVLAFYIPAKLRTPFSKKIVVEEQDGKSRKRMEITFEDQDQLLSPDVLDGDF